MQKLLTAAVDAERERWAALARTQEAEIGRLRAVLEKIADWDSSWGPFPENSEAWRAMVVVTAREAVPFGPNDGNEGIPMSNEYGPNVRIMVRPGPPPSCDLVVEIKEDRGWREVGRFNDMSDDYGHTRAGALAHAYKERLHEHSNFAGSADDSAPQSN